MQAITIVAVVADLLAAGKTQAQIAATLEAMGFIGADIQTGDPAAEQPEATDPTAERRAQLQAELDALDNPAAVPQTRNQRRNGGQTPQVTYHMAAGWTGKRIAENLSGRKLQVATVILAAGKAGITKREILTKLAKQDPNVTDGAVMSAIHPLKADVKAIISRDIPGAPKPGFAVRKPGAGARVR